MLKPIKPELRNKRVEGSGTGRWLPPVNVWPVFTAPKVLAMAVIQVKLLESVPDPVNCKECPMGALEGSITPMFVLVKPFAGPANAVKEPS